MDFLNTFNICNICIFGIILYYTVKYIKYNLTVKDNRKFYNEIVTNRVVHHLSPLVHNADFITAFNRKSSLYDIAGFDCEWAPERHISLIQIAFPDGHTFLIRLFDSKAHIPEGVIQWLKDSSKLKFGVGVLEDARKLESQWQIDLRGSVDLRHLAVRLKDNKLTKMGLKNLAKELLHINYRHEGDKSILESVQCSNWEQETLSDDQIEYACLDGIVGALCPVEFLCRKLSLPLTDVLSNLSKIKPYCQGCIDLKYKSKSNIHNKNNINNNMNSKRRGFVSGKMFSRASPIYDNASLLTPNGEMLSRLSKKKAEWYLRRSLGVIVSEEPFVVKLLFEPSGRSSGANDYYVQEKENVCVVCGSDGGNGCVRKNVVPSEYRKHYPVSHKSHKSHDVLPLCVDCHRQSNILDDAMKKQLSATFKAPLGPKESVNFGKSKVKMAARALRYQDKIPAARVEELKSIILNYCNLETIDSAILEQISEMDIGCGDNVPCYSSDSKYIPHGQVIVSSLKTAADLVDFEVMWRKHFVETMKPQYLPVGWSTHHRVDRYYQLEPK